MIRMLIPFLLLSFLGSGCTSTDKSNDSAAAPAAKPAPAPTAASSKTPATPAARRGDTVYAYVDAARHDLSDGKVTVINRVMRLTAEESGKFWPIYRDYEEE